ncbi:hypothetical protein QIW53_18910 [Pseudomonas fluorescens]|uniref:hypothetical protein n=1 Tax=Pseudomonas fluorescens TaxID=294 RepID=UPI0035248380
MLAMVANDDAGNLTPRSGPGSFASMLAPTEKRPRLWIHKKNAEAKASAFLFSAAFQ